MNLVREDMRAVIAMVLAACAATSAPVAPPRVDAPPSPPSEAEIKRLSYAVLDAYDRGEVAVVETLLAPELLHFEGGEPSTRDKELAQLRKRKPGGPHIAKRTWDSEHVQARTDDAVFIGKATEIQGGNETKGGYRYVGWYTLHWVRRGGAWQLRLWQWMRGGETSIRDSWNDIYRNGVGYNREPNRLLVETVKGKQPGIALDVAMGQGRNAVFLATQGWKVTGVDISDEGLRIARDEADKRGLTLQTVNTNIDAYDFGIAKWDLVTMIYATANVGWIEKIKPSLGPGGLFVVEFFAIDDEAEGGFKRGQLAKLFASGFDILRDDLVEGVPDWAMDHAKLVRFVARKR